MAGNRGAGADSAGAGVRAWLASMVGPNSGNPPSTVGQGSSGAGGNSGQTGGRAEAAWLRSAASPHTSAVWTATRDRLTGAWGPGRWHLSSRGQTINGDVGQGLVSKHARANRWQHLHHAWISVGGPVGGPRARRSWGSRWLERRRVVSWRRATEGGVQRLCHLAMRHGHVLAGRQHLHGCDLLSRPHWLRYSCSFHG